MVALAVQYGHLRTPLTLDTTTASGYATRSRRGIHDLIDIETALATAETAADLHERHPHGEGVSGPAARHALRQAATTHRFEGTTITPAFARKFLARDGAVLYDNPHALLLCRYDSATALCERGTHTHTPALDRCVAGCPNMLRTDQHAAQLRHRADHLTHQAEHLPDSIAERLHTAAARLRHHVDTHDATRITPEPTS
ncbi:hypothetical protein [Streptomyces olindensis]|uniref:hypothetical protein n=2 Tax=Streptomyces TaxID=1883 RepID=UPI003667B9A4